MKIVVVNLYLVVMFSFSLSVSQCNRTDIWNGPPLAIKKPPQFLSKCFQHLNSSKNVSKEAYRGLHKLEELRAEKGIVGLRARFLKNVLSMKTEK